MVLTHARLSLAVVAWLTVVVSGRSPAVDVLSAVGGLPPNLVGQMREPAAFVETVDGRYLVFDRRAQTVFSVDAKKTALTRLMPLGPSDGEILRPLAFAMSQESTFVILDNPGDYERVQVFHDTGTPLSVFRRWPTKGDVPRLNGDASIVSGLGPITVIGRELLAQAPDGEPPRSLVSQFDTSGRITRRIGQLRATGHEDDPALHHALNIGLPLTAPDGAIYFVFTTGVPMFRKYSAAGDLLFERHVEGPELDAVLQALPSVWPRRTVEGREFPYVDTTVRTAAVDPQGRLWISLAVPFTYVYDGDGNKVRTVQFRGAGVMSPTSLFFAKGGRLLATPGCYEFDVR